MHYQKLHLSNFANSQSLSSSDYGLIINYIIIPTQQFRVNSLLSNLQGIGPESLIKVLSHQCCSFYGSGTWNLKDPSVKAFHTTYNRGLRRLLNLPSGLVDCPCRLRVSKKDLWDCISTWQWESEVFGQYGKSICTIFDCWKPGLVQESVWRPRHIKWPLSAQLNLLHWWWASKCSSCERLHFWKNRQRLYTSNLPFIY